jgi:hypothetical protein
MNPRLLLSLCVAVDAARGTPAGKGPSERRVQRPPVRIYVSSDFRIFDNREPQEIASFEEHGKGNAVLSSAPGALPPGAFSNAYLEHPPHVLNILFIDLTNIEIADPVPGLRDVEPLHPAMEK